MDSAKRRTTENPFQINAQGFMPEQMAGVEMFGKNMFNDVSANYASRGLNSPANINGVIGSAVAAAAPQLMGMAQQNLVANENAAQGRFAQLNQAMQLYPSLLGNEQHSSSKTTAPGMGYTFGNSFANTLGQKAAEGLSSGASAALMCWIAEAVYGKDAVETHLARFYVNTVLPLTKAGRAFRAWYLKHGQRVADMVTKSPTLKARVKPLFDNMVRNAVFLLRGF
jgi:hypothetical protein